MISTTIVLQIHNALIDVYGGTKGIRDSNTLDSAINRPFATFDGIDLYPTIIHKGAAIFQSILINHPFLDGNKRTAFAMLVYLLKFDNLELQNNEPDMYDFIISCSKGEKEFEEIVVWIQSNSKSF
jgi:death on curing protein